MADELDDLKQRILDLQRGYESLRADYFEVSLRSEAIRFLCETAGLFSHEDFEQALKTIDERARAGGEAGLENQRASRIVWMREMLRRADGDPQ